MRLAILTVLAFLTVVTGPALAEAPAIKVMSFNVRLGTANDGDDHWDKRKELLIETIKATNPDLLGTQETVGFQKEFIARHLPDYHVIGVGRDDGKEKGEMMAIYIRKQRFDVIASGHLWLSETPDVAGSKSWDSSLPRMATWAHVKDKSDASGRDLVFANTHFDHRGNEARLESGKLIHSRVVALEGLPVILTGDFNAAVDSPPYQALFASHNGEPLLIDTYREFRKSVADADTKNDGTFNGFKADSTQGARIDWIGVTKNFEIQSATINRFSKNGRVPSDHFPIEAVLNWKADK